jgi:hypothetical protein
MLKRFLIISAFFSVFPAVTCADELPPIVQFESAGHADACAQVKLKFAGTPADKLLLTNGLQLSYGEICALGGDLYGVPESPIALGANAEERKQRFLDAFATLDTASLAVAEVPKILDVLHEEEQQVQDGIKNGEDPAEIYARMGSDHDIAWNCITGGFCPADHPDIPADVVKQIYYLDQGRYLKLADRDFDHFGAEAWLAYSSGHAAALEVAANAKQDAATLQMAYAMNAFACHFLTDLFSSGHMRTPHLALYNSVTPSSLGSALSAYMHREDSTSGLTVSNLRGDTWFAFGDRNYFEKNNNDNRTRLIHVLQISADEIFAAFTDGKVPTAESAIANLIPDLNKLSHDDAHINTAPLFYWDDANKEIMRRSTLSDSKSYTWTAYWLGWGTLSELWAERGVP